MKGEPQLPLAFPSDFARKVIERGLKERRSRRLRIVALASSVLVVALGMRALSPPAPQPLTRVAYSTSLGWDQSPLSNCSDEHGQVAESSGAEGPLGGRLSFVE